MFVRGSQLHSERKSSMATITSFIILLEVLLIIQSDDVSGSESSSSSCSHESMEACEAPLSQLRDKQGHIIAVNRTELLKVCVKLRPALECVDDFLGRCFGVGRNEMDKLFSGYRVYIFNVCQLDSQFSQEYLKYAPCMAEANNKTDSCTNDSRFMMVNPMVSPMPNELTPTVTTDMLDKVCCMMEHFLTCSENVYFNHCGADAAKLGRQTLLTMYGPTIQSKCMDDYGNFKCSGSVRPFPVSLITSLLSLAATLLALYNNNYC